MDLAAPEMVRVAKDAYTFEYELQLRKEQNEGDLNKELATLNETGSRRSRPTSLSTRHRWTPPWSATNRARLLAHQRASWRPSPNNANAALLQPSALDIRAVSGRRGPGDPQLPLPGEPAGQAGVGR